MSRACTVCGNSNYQEINRLLVNGTSNRAIARQFALSRAAVDRHKNNHLPNKLVNAKIELDILESKNLSKHFNYLYQNILDILESSKSSGESKITLHDIKETRSYMGLLVKSSEIFLQNKNETTWEHCFSIILEALREYPDARVAVSEALLRADST